MIRNYIGRKIGRQSSGILILITLLTVSMTAGCSESDTKQANTAAPLPKVQETASSPVPQSPKTKVVTTFLPIYLFTKAVVGDAADVEILVPPGTEVHEYQAKPENVKAIATANVLVKNGLGLEQFLAATVKNAQNPKLIEIDSSKGIKALEPISPIVKTTKTEKEKEKDHEHEAGNPHIWLDPVLAKNK